MSRSHRLAWLLLIATLTTTVSAGARTDLPKTLSKTQKKIALPKNLLTIYTDYADRGVTQYADSVTGRILATVVSKPKRGQAAGGQGTAPSPGQRCSNSGSYNYFDAGVWRPWRMSSYYQINPSGAPSGMVGDWRNQLTQAKYVWEQTRNMCNMGAVIIWRMPMGGDSYVSPNTDCGQPDSTNLVGFADFGGWDAEGIILARTCNWSGSEFIYESDLIFNNNPDAKWANGSFAGYWDLQSVAAHEFGHSLGLGHVQNDASYSTALAVMHPIVYRQDIRNRTLSRGDVEGAWHLYPALHGYKIISAKINNPAGDGVNLEPGRSYVATIDVENTGYSPWSVGYPFGISVATSPAGRCSTFVAGDWGSCQVPTALDEDLTNVNDTDSNTSSVVAQGEVGRFAFSVPVDWAREGTTNREWFRIINLPIAQQTVPIDINAGTYAATSVSQFGPGYAGLVFRGVTAGASIDVRNDGTAPWILDDGRIRLVTDPIGRCSPYASGWQSCSVASVLSGSNIVLPGQTATMTFNVYAPLQFTVPQGEHKTEKFDLEVVGRPAGSRLGAKSTFEFTIY